MLEPLCPNEGKGNAPAAQLRTGGVNAELAIFLEAVSTQWQASFQLPLGTTAAEIFPTGFQNQPLVFGVETGVKPTRSRRGRRARFSAPGPAARPAGTTWHNKSLERTRGN
jgi:hypothetical protein